jgi:galactokinase
MVTNKPRRRRRNPRQYGVDLTQFAARQQAQAPAQPQTNDPAMAAVLAEVQQLKQFITTQQNQAVEAENARVQESIAAFASDPKHPHFPTVRTMMGALMQAGTAKDLDTAYEMACRAHPEVFKAIQQTEAETKAKAEAQERAKAAASAKTKAVSVRGAVPAPGARTPPATLRGLLEAAWDGRVN